MADKNYRLTFELNDGTRKSVEFTAPQGEKGDRGETGVYILSEGEKREDAPREASVVIDPYGDEENGAASSLEDMLTVEIMPETALVYDADMDMYAFTDLLDIKTGERYVVTVNGVQYLCMAFSDDGQQLLVNEGADLNTGEGLSVGIMVFPERMDGIGGGCMLAEPVETMTMSITGFRKIPDACLPEKQYFFNMYKDSSGTWMANTLYETLVDKVKRGIQPIAVIEYFGSQDEMLHVPFAVLDETVDRIAFSLTTQCVPFEDNNTGGFYLLCFLVAKDNTAQAYAARINAAMEMI